jgi:hypothetical protein
VQDLDDLSLNLYVGWRRFKYSDQLGNTYKDADGILVGVRWYFLRSRAWTGGKTATKRARQPNEPNGPGSK